MAVWQYSLRALQSNRHLPDKTYTNARNIEEAWSNNRLLMAPLAEQIDLLLPRSDWSSLNFLEWKGDDKQNEDYDCWLAVAPQNQTIQEFSFRTDF